MRLFTGTSGFAYKEWKGGFYPRSIPTADMLGYYAERFPAVEINNTFYRMPSEDVLRQWAMSVPEGFVFAIKAPQEITHRKRLKEVGEPAARFFGALDALGGRLGPVLVQLPPNQKKDLARLAGFLELRPPAVRVAVEFRNESWFDDEVFALLRENGVALCVAHGEKVDAPILATTDWGYVRLRKGEYSEAELAEWVQVVRGEAGGWTDAFVFFMHEDTGTGPTLARRFADLYADESGE
jgi:uncharacterized protein YecE (DUF72 family)